MSLRNSHKNGSGKTFGIRAQDFHVKVDIAAYDVGSGQSGYSMPKVSDVR